MAAHFIVGCDVLTPDGRQGGLGVLVERGRILAVLPEGGAGAAARVVLPPDALLAPGFIDIQVNGGGGVLFNDQPTAEAALAMAAAHRRLGTTGILPTLITSEPAVMRAAAAAARPAVAARQGVLGVHFEGPFLSPDKPGVHRADLIRGVTDEDLATLGGLAEGWDGRVLLTLAPECVAACVQNALAGAGVILSAGHSAASFEAVRAPVRGVTHVFNAMPPAMARAPGLVTAALLGDFYAGVILDLIHVHPAMLRLLFAAKALDRIMLVSDAMSVAGTDLAGFALQGRGIFRRNGRLETADGTLAGADLCLAQAVRNGILELGLPAEDVIGMATSVPATFLGLSAEVGRVAAGLRADFTVLAADYAVLGTFLGGAWQGRAGVLAA